MASKSQAFRVGQKAPLCLPLLSRSSYRCTVVLIIHTPGIKMPPCAQVLALGKLHITQPGLHQWVWPVRTTHTVTEPTGRISCSLSLPCPPEQGHPDMGSSAEGLSRDDNISTEWFLSHPATHFLKHQTLLWWEVEQVPYFSLLHTGMTEEGIFLLALTFLTGCSCSNQLISRWKRCLRAFERLGEPLSAYP